MTSTYRNSSGNKLPTRFCRNHPDRVARERSGVCPECDNREKSMRQVAREKVQSNEPCARCHASVRLPGNSYCKPCRQLNDAEHHVPDKHKSAEQIRAMHERIAFENLQRLNAARARDGKERTG
jgi:hypothetical protein